MNCKVAEVLIVEFVFGELDPNLRGPLEEHLAACADCARSLERTRALGRAAAALPDVPAPPVRMPRRPVRFWSAAAAVLAFALGVALASSMRRAPAPVREIVEVERPPKPAALVLPRAPAPTLWESPVHWNRDKAPRPSTSLKSSLWSLAAWKEE